MSISEVYFFTFDELGSELPKVLQINRMNFYLMNYNETECKMASGNLFVIQKLKPAVDCYIILYKVYIK